MILKGISPSGSLKQLQHIINQKHYKAIDLDSYSQNEILIVIYNPSLLQVNYSSFELL